MKTFKEVAANAVAGGGVDMNPTGKPKKQKETYKEFSVDNETFNKFSTGRNKFERWNKFLNLEDEGHKAIYNYAKTNKEAVIVLKNSETGALRALRRRSSNGL